jgi:hypothetical protein
MHIAGNSDVIPVHAIKADGGVEIQLNTRLTLAVVGVKGQLHAPTALS